MLSLRRKKRTDRVMDALLTAASYADGAVHDNRLRSDLRSAVDHSAGAAKRIRRDIGVSSSILRLAEDKKLRKNIKALVEDLDSASDRIRGKKRHRLRNVLVLAGLGSLAVAIPDVRRWFATHIGSQDSGDTFATAV
jgi:hypothetical protein